ncbi:hypothetical protein EVAR_79867_1 [Eumeta japonica]|uniref:SWIM-type domain-containing protein n=1 Tax=Eumeta variegata TaxID=151549 RepID=A0A4C1TZ34_EUMVA|nr:hypothetical protein EVAR_79867_1 [Eumeta japonica]
MDEQEEAVKSIECHDCVASQGGCKHAIAFLMWIHRRSEEPSCTSVECYWMKSKLSRAGSTLKYLTASEMSNAKPSLPSNTEVFEKFLEEGKKRRLNNCELAFHNEAPSLATVCHWPKDCKRGRTNLRDNLPEGRLLRRRPTTSVLPGS